MKDLSRTALLKQRVLSVHLRPYQQDALDVLLAGVHKGKRRFHVVAPPGSGKTIIGIAFMQLMEMKTVILSPNSAIQAQWMDKYGRSTSDIVDVFGEIWGNDLRGLISHDPSDNTPVLSLTYQRLTVRDGERAMHANVEELVAQLRDEGFGLLILDECHHLVAFWAEVLKEVLNSVDLMVLGLTATPPFDRGNREQSMYLDLVGEVDYSIPLPAVVKDGNLAPWQDLVYLVHPAEREIGFIRARHEQFHTLITSLNDASPPLDTLNIHVQRVLDAPLYRGISFASYSMFLRERPSAALAFARYALSRSIPLPPDASHIDEMDEAPVLDDIVLILQGYVDDALSATATSEAFTLIENISEALGRLGFDTQNGVFSRRASSIDRILAVSSSKLPALCTVLTREMRNLGEHIRALVLTDFETAQAGTSRALEGILDPDAGGAVAVMRTLTSNPETDQLDAVMLTGSTVLCDDDLAQSFLKELRLITAREHLDITFELRYIDNQNHGSDAVQLGSAEIDPNSVKGMYEIMGKGRDWSTRTYVLMITELFDRGVTRCLVGTRGLLGEGWDSASVNVLVDLTAVASYVSVNQMHGRSLRLDAEHPEKVANNWDIVAVLPEYERGFADWDRFVRKHEHLYGLSDDGELERGIGHVHPLLTHVDTSDLTAVIAVVNEDMLRRGTRRDEAYRAWRIGGEYSGIELPCFEFRPERSTPRTFSHTGRSIELLERSLEEFRVKRRRGRIGVVIASIFAAVAALAAASFAAVAPTIPVLAGVVLTVAVGETLLRGRLKRLRSMERSIDLGEELMLFAAVVRDTIVALRNNGDIAEPGIQSSERQDGSMRFWINSGVGSENEIFQRALGELFHPIQDQRYVLRRWRLASGKKLADLINDTAKQSWFEDDGLAPVPSDFGRRREDADIFYRMWERHLGKADVLYTRRGEGASLLGAHLRKRLIPGRRFAKRIWI